MKKIALICISFIICTNLVFAETWYTMSEKDYQRLADTLDFYSDIKEAKTLYGLTGQGLTDKAITLDLREELQHIQSILVKVDTDSDALRRFKFQQAADKAAKETDRQLGLTDRLSVDEKLSILGGRIALLEMEIIKLRGKK